MRQRCTSGMVARGLDGDGGAVRQLEYQLEVIGRMGIEGYFLAVAQVVAAFLADQLVVYLLRDR
ncbi:hypothetical protein ACIRP3_01215 [Streptomyces sp. NPDC101209]|uniref:hypothetical protein n=1 Tax=Streptomyces sp. NPDC101209 TaxID=3366129 RepID=UPI003826530F